MVDFKAIMVRLNQLMHFRTYVKNSRLDRRATKWTAEAMRVADKIGTVEPGKIADIIVVDADPLAGIANLRKISAVVFDGKQVELGYHSWFSTPFLGGGTDRSVVDDVPWTQSLKQVTFRQHRRREVKAGARVIAASDCQAIRTPACRQGVALIYGEPARTTLPGAMT